MFSGLNLFGLLLLGLGEGEGLGFEILFGTGLITVDEFLFLAASRGEFTEDLLLMKLKELALELLEDETEMLDGRLRLDVNGLDEAGLIEGLDFEDLSFSSQ